MAGHVMIMLVVSWKLLNLYVRNLWLAACVCVCVKQSIIHTCIYITTNTTQHAMSDVNECLMQLGRYTSSSHTSDTLSVQMCMGGRWAAHLARKRTYFLLLCRLVSQRSLHNAPIFRLLLKVAVNGTHQCDFPNFCGQQCPTS